MWKHLPLVCEASMGCWPARRSMTLREHTLPPFLGAFPFSFCAPVSATVPEVEASGCCLLLQHQLIAEYAS